MRSFQLVLVFFTTLTLFHYTFGEPPVVLSDSPAPFYHEFNGAYSNAGDEVPWPMIVKPYWVFPDDEGKNGQPMGERGKFTEHRISGQSVGLWQEIDPMENPRVFEVKVIDEMSPSSQELFEVVQIDFATKEPVYLPGHGRFVGDSESSSETGRGQIVQPPSDKAGYYVVLHSNDKSKQLLRLAEVQDPSSDEVLLGVSIVNAKDRFQSNHLLRRVE